MCYVTRFEKACKTETCIVHTSDLESHDNVIQFKKCRDDKVVILSKYHNGNRTMCELRLYVYFANPIITVRN